MTLKVFPWSPVTAEWADGSRTHLVLSATYEDDPDFQAVMLHDQVEAKRLSVGAVEKDSLEQFVWQTVGGDRIILRPTVPTDMANTVQFNTRVPLPVEIIGAIMSSTIPEPNLAAAVDEQGDVHTVVLETGVGLYARYANTWISLNAGAIDQLDLWDIPQTDLAYYDAADAKGTVINIRDLNPFERPSTTTVPVPVPPVEAPVTTAAATIIVSSAADLPEAIAYAAENPTARWYVARRARALGWEEPLPWNDEDGV